jgi:predicted glycosyltransferase
VSYKVVIYVQHLLGAGHLVRAMSLAEALAECEHQVLLLSGGFPIDRPVCGYQFFQLPPVRAIDGDFTRLVDEHAASINDRWRADRAAQMLEAVRDFEPDLVITETFPFGRRQFRFELEPLISWVKSQAGVRLLSSIRDVLQRRSDVRNRQTVETIRQYYDAVLVHADDSLFKLDASFPLSHEIEDKLSYTGYIHQPVTPNPPLPPFVKGGGNSDGLDEIIVSGGSGTVSANLLETARLARPMSLAKSRVWRLLSGRNNAAVFASSDTGLIIEPNRPDFFKLLGRCALSVSQSGYNTTLDVLASGARSVMVPFAGDGETEQSDRAQALERAGRLIQVAETDLTPQHLAYAINRALKMKPVELSVNLNGAANSARWITQKLMGWN